MTALREGQRVRFLPGGKPPGRKGRFVKYLDQAKHPGIVHVRLDTDPFDVCVNVENVATSSSDRKTDEQESTKMPTTTAKPKARELRREAKSLGVEGWEDMDADELAAAIEEAKEGAETATTSKKAKGKTVKAAPAKSGKAKTKTVKAVEPDEDDDEDDEDDEDEAPAPAKKASKKAAAKAPAKAAKKATKKAVSKAAKDDDEDDLPENGNPFTVGTNLYWMAEELIKGGKRSAMVKRLNKKISLNPRTRTLDEDETIKEIDRRLVIVSQVMRNEHGFSMEREGRGADTVIRLFKE